MKRELEAGISAVAGACALSIAGLWYWVSWNDGLGLPLPDVGEVRQLYGLALLGLIFQFGTPVLNIPAWVLGIKARSHWAAKAGMVMAGISVVMYVAYLRFIFKLVTAE